MKKYHRIFFSAELFLFKKLHVILFSNFLPTHTTLASGLVYFMSTHSTLAIRLVYFVSIHTSLASRLVNFVSIHTTLASRLVNFVSIHTTLVSRLVYFLSIHTTLASWLVYFVSIHTTLASRLVNFVSIHTTLASRWNPYFLTCLWAYWACWFTKSGSKLSKFRSSSFCLLYRSEKVKYKNLFINTWNFSMNWNVIE